MAKRRACPCGSGVSYPDCCGRLHRGQAWAATAEELMRSRYSAYVMHETSYLLETWHPATRPERIDFDPELRWERLNIVATEDGGPEDTTGVVEFRAHYRIDSTPGVLHEVSRFRRQDGSWVYVRGRVTPG